MTDDEKKAQGKYYIIDEERHVIIYDPSHNHYGKRDEFIPDTTKNMAEIATRENIPVESTCNQITFQIAPGMTAEEAQSAFVKAQNLKQEKYHNSPEYVNEQLEKAKKKVELKKIEEQMQSETLDVEGQSRYFNELANTFSENEFKNILTWGKLMQAEMKKQGLNYLTPEIVKMTSEKCAHDCGKTATVLGLASVWKHGEELAKIEGYDTTDIAVFRAVSSDKAKDFYDKYRPTPTNNWEDAINQDAKIIATVLPTEDLVRNFVKKTHHKGNCIDEAKKMIPILKLPPLSESDAKDLPLNTAANKALRYIRQAEREKTQIKQPQHTLKERIARLFR